MSSDYTPRHGAPRRARRVPAMASMKRPVVGAGIAVALVASVGAALDGGQSVAAPGEAQSAPTGRGAPAGDAVTALSSPDAADVERLAQDRRQAAAGRSESREQAKIAEAERRAAAKKKVAAEKKKVAAQKRRSEAKVKQERIAAVQKDPKPYAIEIMREHGFTDDQWGCLQSLWTGESDFRWDATNPTSGAYGIPQSLPASKMSAAGSDWKTNPETQMRWGMGYIKEAYGSPCQAYQFWSDQSPHWY